jgi:hypothetical protein
LREHEKSQVIREDVKLIEGFDPPKLTKPLLWKNIPTGLEIQPFYKSVPSSSSSSSSSLSPSAVSSILSSVLSASSMWSQNLLNANSLGGALNPYAVGTGWPALQRTDSMIPSAVSTNPNRIMMQQMQTQTELLKAVTGEKQGQN